MKSLVDKNINPVRDIGLDLLKTIGILCIILAHTSPPDLIYQLRNFDVPLMVLVSGTLLSYSDYNRNSDWGKYLRKRIPRLLAPVWLFFLGFFATSYLIIPLIGRENKFTLMSLMATLSLRLIRARGEVNMVWIIRVFLLIAAISPLLLKWRQKLANDKLFLASLFMAYVGYEGLFLLIGNPDDPVLKITVYRLVFYLIPYGAVCGLGMTLPRLKPKYLLTLAMACLGIFLGISIFSYANLGELLPTQLYKRPPRLYYLSYALFVSTMLYLLIHKYQANLNALKLQVKNFIVFVSSSTLWIYLWHFFFLHYWKLTLPLITSIANHYIVLFIGITFLSLATTYFQKQIVSRAIATTRLGQKYSQLLKVLFLQ